jgi:hypothetical protein
VFLSGPERIKGLKEKSGDPVSRVDGRRQEGVVFRRPIRECEAKGNGAVLQGLALPA